MGKAIFLGFFVGYLTLLIVSNIFKDSSFGFWLMVSLVVGIATAILFVFELSAILTTVLIVISVLAIFLVVIKQFTK